MHRDAEDPEPVPRELETGLFIRRFERHQSTYLVTEISVRPVHLEPGEPRALAFHGCCQAQIDHPVTALEVEGFEIPARYDGRHFYDSHHAYRVLHGTVGSRRAQVMARRMRDIDQAFAARAAAGQPALDSNGYPELVVSIGEIIRARFAKYPLDPDPGADHNV